MSGAGEDPKGGVPAQAGAACVACYEPIHAKATVCPHCGSRQGRSTWRVAGSLLKWVGGTAAVLSLILSAWRLNDVVSQWREREAAVANLLAAAQFQSESKDLEGAWETIQQALELEPASRDARRARIVLAMKRVRRIWRSGPAGARIEATDPYMSVLYSGAVDEDADFAADVLAHLGWASHLRRAYPSGELEVEEHYRRALELDPDNVYANAMLGHWILWDPSGPEDVDRAMAHFRAALDTGLETTLVEDLQTDALTYRARSNPQAVVELVKIANERRLEKRPPTGGLQSYLRPLFDRIMAPPYEPREDEVRKVLLEQLSPKTLRETFDWLVSRYDEPTPTDRFVQARLLEAEGRTEEALAMYERVLRHPQVGSSVREAAVSAVARLSP